jgi:hypothetical protein
MNITFDITDLPHDLIEETSSALEKINSSYTCSNDFDIKCDFKEFALFQDYESVEVQNLFTVIRSGKSCHLSLLRVTYTYQTKWGTRLHTDLQLWGIATLKNDFGHVIIKPETLGDKIHEWLHSVELDFEEDPQFSRRFFVLAKDKEKIRKAMSANFRNKIMDIPGNDFLIEIKNSLLIIGNKKNVSLEAAENFTAFLSKF